MSLTGEILWAWRHGWGRGLRRQMESGAGEERALGWVMLATLLIIVASAPASFRNIVAAGTAPVEAPIALIMSSLFTLFLGPLTFYGIAAVAHIAARMAGATGPFLHARLGLFWALLCVAPLVLLTAILGNLLGPALAKPLQYFGLFAFLLIWADTMSVAEQFGSRLRTGLALAAIGGSVLVLIGMLPTG